MPELYCYLVGRSFAVFIFYLPFLMNFINFRNNKSTRKHDIVMRRSKYARAIRKSFCFVHVSKWKVTNYFNFSILSGRVYFFFRCTSCISSSYSYNNNLNVLLPVGNMYNALKTSLTYRILQNYDRNHIVFLTSIFLRVSFSINIDPISTIFYE